MIEETMVAALKGETVAGARIYPLMLPGPDPTLPAVVYQRISTHDEQSHEGPGLVQPRFQLSCWGTTYDEARALYHEVDLLLDGQRHDGAVFLAAGVHDGEDVATREGEQLGRCRVMADYVVSHVKATV